MDAGQVIYATPGGNLFLVSFGGLHEVTERFKTLAEYRDASLARIQRQGNISGGLAMSNEITVCGHRALLSNFRGNNLTGDYVDVWSLDLWCDTANRYYSIYGDLSHKEEFPRPLSAFGSVAQSLVCHRTSPAVRGHEWEWADLGFDTRSKVWFLQLYNFSGLIGIYQAGGITLEGASAVQYQWPQGGERPMWHVRERIFSREVDDIRYDEHGGLVLRHSIADRPKERIPEGFDSITYAYSLSTARGFVEFRDQENVVLKRIDDRWIAVENLRRKTVGTFPNIRLEAKKEDIENIVLTNTCIVIEGKAAS
jgi:hypothetical protein